VTIIELLIVIAIIGVLVTLALPKISVARYKINTGMRIVGTGLLTAQRRAVSVQHDVIVTFNPTTHIITMIEDANNNGKRDGGERSRAISQGEGVLIARGATPSHAVGPGPVTFTRTVGGVPAVTFHRNGSASEYGGVYLTSQRAVQTGAHVEDTRLITVERATGRVSWFHYATQWNRGF
jgi:Tfp pilus assembly protein FimT